MPPPCIGGVSRDRITGGKQTEQGHPLHDFREHVSNFPYVPLGDPTLRKHISPLSLHYVFNVGPQWRADSLTILLQQIKDSFQDRVGSRNALSRKIRISDQLAAHSSCLPRFATSGPKIIVSTFSMCSGV